MINLNAYDIMESNITTGTWVNPYYRKLYSTELKHFTFYTFMKRYNIKFRRYDYFIVLSNDEIPNAVSRGVTTNKRGNIKLDVSTIWNTTSLAKLRKETIVSVELIDEDEESAVYYIDI